MYIVNDNNNKEHLHSKPSKLNSKNDFTKCALLAISLYMEWSKMDMLKCCKIKNYFFIIKLPDAHLEYICHIPAKY